MSAKRTVEFLELRIQELEKAESECRKAQAELRESEKRYREIIDFCPLPFLVTQEEKIVFGNAAAAKLFGTNNHEEVLGSSPNDWIHPDFVEQAHKRRSHAIETGKALEPFELTLVRKDKKEAVILANTTGISHNGFPALLSLFQDITKQKRTEEALEESRKRLRLFVDSTPDFCFLKDRERRYVMINAANARFFGMTESEILGKTDFDLMPEEAARGCMKTDICAMNEGRKVIDIECVDDRVYETHKMPVFNNNEVVGVAGIIRDITEQNQAEARRRNLEARLRETQKMEAIGTLAGGIAHDFNNILSIILGNAELVMHDLPEGGIAREGLEEVCKASLRARDLVTQILLFARQKDHIIADIQIESIAEDSLKMLRASIPTTVEIRQDIESDLPSILADPAQVQQLIMNLCTNAGQAMEAEGGTLEFTLGSTELQAPLGTLTGSIPKGRYVRIGVRDTGPGIASKILERIFEPFFTTKGVGEGTGLGLAVVHGIVQDRNGGITVKSAEGKGSAFTVYLPVSEEGLAGKTAEQPAEQPKRAERILFVDDEPMILRVGQKILENRGYQVETRSSGSDALECFRQNANRFDLVVTDMTMPGLRGDKLAEEIMKIRPDIPVILCTGYSKQISEERARKIGIRAFVMKPLPPRELAETVRRVLDET